MKGKFIVFEGIDGAGKTTQLDLLRQELANRGYPVVYTREPGGTRIGELIREILLNPQHDELAPRTEAFLYAAARAQLVAQVILPALMKGKIVLCDRFVDSTLAYQGFGRGMDIPMLEQINQPATAGLVPDLILLLDFCCDFANGRIGRSGRGADRIEQEKREFHRRVRSGYLALAGREPGRYKIIDAAGPVEQIRDDILEAVREVLSEVPAGNNRT